MRDYTAFLPACQCGEADRNCDSAGVLVAGLELESVWSTARQPGLVVCSVLGPVKV